MATYVLYEDSFYFRKEYYISNSEDQAKIKEFCRPYGIYLSSLSKEAYDFALTYLKTVIYYSEDYLSFNRPFWIFNEEGELQMQVKKSKIVIIFSA